MSEVKTSVDNFQQSVQQSYLEILTRVRGLENQRANSLSQDVTAVTRTDIEERVRSDPDWRGGSTAKQFSTSNSSRFFSRIFEKDLAVTRAYKRIQWRHSITSIFTTEHPETRWSTFSDLSVADVVSKLSVYDLAISPSEIHKSQQYTLNPKDETERVSIDSRNEGIFGIRMTLTEATKTTNLGPRDAKELDRSRRYWDLALLEPTAAVIDEILLKTGVTSWNNAWLSRHFYGIPDHGRILDNQVANALQYFDQFQEKALSLTTDKVLRDVLRILGVLGPHADLHEAGKYTLYILYDEAIIFQRRWAWIQRLELNDAPLHLIRDLQDSNRKPWLIIQPEAILLPVKEYVDLTYINLGRFVDGWLVHHDLFYLHVSDSYHPLM